jgi:erythromycin esterase
MKIRNFLLGLGLGGILLSAGCSKGNVPQQDADDLYTKLKEAGIESTFVPFSPFPSLQISDLSGIGASLEGKLVIGMGEATHGSAEFQKVKHRFFQMLAQTKAYRALIIEENFSAVVPLNQYILSGSGDLDMLLKGLRSNMFKTSEFKALMIWMRTFNNGKTDAEKVQVFGMDAQNTGFSARAIQQSVAAYDAGYLSSFNTDAVSFLADLQNYGSEQEALKDLPNLKNAIRRIRGKISQNSLLYIGGLGARGYNVLLQHVRIIEQALEQYSGFAIKMSKGFEVRDANMSENVEWVETYMGMGTKRMVWVHNGHINLQKQAYFGDGAISVLGTNLKAKYGNAFYSIGFVFNQGRTRAVNGITGKDEVFTLQPQAKNILSNALAKFEHPCFFYGISNGSVSVRNALGASYQVFQMGAVYDNKVKNALWTYNISKEFDGIVFLDTVSPLTPL